MAFVAQAHIAYFDDPITHFFNDLRRDTREEAENDKDEIIELLLNFVGKDGAIAFADNVVSTERIKYSQVYIIEIH